MVFVFFLYCHCFNLLHMIDGEKISASSLRTELKIIESLKISMNNQHTGKKKKEFRKVPLILRKFPKNIHQIDAGNCFSKQEIVYMVFGLERTFHAQ